MQNSKLPKMKMPNLPPKKCTKSKITQNAKKLKVPNYQKKYTLKNMLQRANCIMNLQNVLLSLEKSYYVQVVFYNISENPALVRISPDWLTFYWNVMERRVDLFLTVLYQKCSVVICSQAQSYLYSVSTLICCYYCSYFLPYSKSNVQHSLM